MTDFIPLQDKVNQLYGHIAIARQALGRVVHCFENSTEEEMEDIVMPEVKQALAITEKFEDIISIGDNVVTPMGAGLVRRVEPHIGAVYYVKLDGSLLQTNIPFKRHELTKIGKPLPEIKLTTEELLAEMVKMERDHTYGDQSWRLAIVEKAEKHLAKK